MEVKDEKMNALQVPSSNPGPAKSDIQRPSPLGVGWVHFITVARINGGTAQKASFVK
jgi:hypothetical protein